MRPRIGREMKQPRLISRGCSAKCNALPDRRHRLYFHLKRPQTRCPVCSTGHPRDVSLGIRRVLGIVNYFFL
jgi:hypothetical protein